MKKILKYFSLMAVALVCFSCEIDNYEGPDAQLEGRIIIKGTGDPNFDGKNLETMQGGGNMTIRMIETSWTESESVSPRDINVMQDGTYINLKLFSASYDIYPYNGPFYPYTEDEYKKIQLKGKMTLDMEVMPYLNVEWVEEPHVIEQPVPDSDPVVTGKYITAKAKFKVNRKTVNGVEITPSVAYGRMYIGTSIYPTNTSVGDYSQDIAYSNADEDQVITFISRRHMFFDNITLYVRVGFRCRVDSPNGITDKFNYTSVIKVKVP